MIPPSHHVAAVSPTRQRGCGDAILRSLGPCWQGGTAQPLRTTAPHFLKVKKRLAMAPGSRELLVEISTGHSPKPQGMWQVTFHLARWRGLCTCLACTRQTQVPGATKQDWTDEVAILRRSREREACVEPTALSLQSPQAERA
jgi:hypothetical protein